MLLSQSAQSIVHVLPTVPPSASSPYTGAQTTAGARASLQRALDNYKTGQLHLPSHKDSLDSHFDSTRSFGETHSAELSSLHTGDPSQTGAPNLPMTPPAQPSFPQHQLGVPESPAASHQQPHPVPAAAVPIPGNSSHLAATPPAAFSPTSPVINPALLNQAPAQIPSSPPSGLTSSTLPVVEPHSTAGGAKAPGITPTVAETGIPVASSGTGGPGPASGSLKDIRREHSESIDARGAPPPQPSSIQLPPPVTATATHESADDEKKRLEREERDRVLAAAAPKHETAEDEKKRLEREERERLLASQADGATRRSTNDDNELPPYQEPGL